MRMHYLPVSVAMITLLGATITRLGRPNVNPHLTPAHSFEALLAPPPGVAATIKRACYDCHSNQTRWPWYSRIPVAGSLVVSDVKKGRAALNFSEWAEPNANPRVTAGRLLAICGMVETREMPRPNYLLLHPGARPSMQETAELCAWTRDAAKRQILDARGRDVQRSPKFGKKAGLALIAATGTRVTR